VPFYDKPFVCHVGFVNPSRLYKSIVRVGYDEAVVVVDENNNIIGIIINNNQSIPKYYT